MTASTTVKNFVKNNAKHCELYLKFKFQERKEEMRRETKEKKKYLT